MKTLLLILFPFFAFGQVKDSTDVAVDTSDAVKFATKYEIVKEGQLYKIRQYQDATVYNTQVVDNKKEVIKKLTTMLRQAKSDEASLLKQLAIIRARKQEIKTARDLYK